jgi:rod shape-determining protein MreC
MSKLISLQFWGFRGASLVFVLTGLFLFALSATNSTALQGLRLAATDALAPVVAIINTPFRVTADYVQAISGLTTLREDNARLLEENARLREWHNAALSLKAENERLGSLLRLKTPEPHGFITARVISDAGNTFAQSLLVLAGVPDGVEKGQPVLSGDGLVGRVIESGGKASRILMLTDINSRVPVTIEGTDTRAILAGQNHPYPLLDHLPPDHKIETGKRVVTSGHGGLFLPGLPVGVTYLDEHGQVFVQLFADSERLSYVRIIDKVLDEGVLEGKLKAGK